MVEMHGLGCAFGYGNISFDSVGDLSNSHLNSHFIGICKSLSIRDAPYSLLESGFPLDPRFLLSISFELMSSYYQLLSAAFRRRGAFLFSEEGVTKGDQTLIVAHLITRSLFELKLCLLNFVAIVGTATPRRTEAL